MTSPLDTPPLENKGAETFARYRYQAKVLLPYAVACARGQAVEGEEILQIVMEHHEDVLLEGRSGWTAVQIKTRDEELGPWRWSHANERGGGLHHLARTVERLGPTIRKCELWLEGSLQRGDEIEQLASSPEERSGRLTLAQSAAAKWGCNLAYADNVLQKTRIRCVAGRRVVEPVVIQSVAGLYGGSSTRTVHYVANQILARLTDAMEARWAREDLLDMIVSGRLFDREVNRVSEKCVSRADLAAYIECLEPLLISSVLPESSNDALGLVDSTLASGSSGTISDLERKLREAGAIDALVLSAKKIRAAASMREQSWLAASRAEPLVDRLLDDLRERLLSIATPLADAHRGQVGRAGRMITELRRELRACVPQLDVPGLVGRDPDVLLGLVYQLSDECRVDWGGPDPTPDASGVRAIHSLGRDEVA